MIRAKIVNHITGRQYGPSKKTEEELLQYLTEGKKKNKWGKPERQLILEEGIQPPEGSKFIEEIIREEPTFDENFNLIEDESGNVVFKKYVRKKYLAPAEYTIEIIKEDKDANKIKEMFKKLREERNMLLKQTDYTQLADAPIDGKLKYRYREYRDYLRKLPSLHNDNSILKYKIKTFEEFNAS